jgi:hypothetical protein
MRRKENNSVYRGTEKNILRALSKILRADRPICIKTCEISKAAGLANSSFYVHYDSLHDLIFKNEAKLLAGLKKLFKKQMKEHNSLETDFKAILLYLYKYRDYLNVVIRAKNVGLPVTILNLLKQIIERDWLDYGYKTNKCLSRLIFAEFIAEFSLWHDEDYSIETIPKHAHHFAYFSKNTQRFFAAIYYGPKK